MSKTPNEQLLFELIKSLTKSEKRSFKIFAKRSGTTNEAKFLRLFDAMDKLEEYDEVYLKKRLTDVSDTQFANLKSHLYSQILASLRLSNLKHDIDIELREQLDYIRVLYKKGLYQQSLRLLKKAKNTTGDYRKDLFQLALLDYEKQIRSQQVFELNEDYVDDLDAQTESAFHRFNNVQKFFTLAIKMKARFIEQGTVKNERDLNNLRALFYTSLPDYNEDELAFNEKFYLYRTFYWFSYLTYDFESCVKYAEKWILIFQDTQLDKKRQSGYLKGLNRLLQSAFRVNDVEKFSEYFSILLQLETSEALSTSNARTLFTKYKAIQHFNNVFLKKDFRDQTSSTTKVLADVATIRSSIDMHSLMVIYYKAGVFYFAISDYETAKSYLNKVVAYSDNLRTDLKGFSRIIDILIAYDTGDIDLMESKIKSALNYIKKEDNLGEFQKSFLSLISGIGQIYPQDLKKSFIELRHHLERLKKNPLDAKPLLYFDLISWLDAKIEGKTFLEIVQKA
ncbi:hypothetical protein [Roseivirga misakiensis]|uniref:Uncharacterized protein n=1 Tax=Roseivirga misakiensis TaxID=1563681 RepID=A0A1E5T025_9BACT|nr:hypothetical protein [Roseivirga misakiensis]OEK04724.1 hypothetical protein BFP71_14850 [Roseivirga misakiensis]